MLASKSDSLFEMVVALPVKQQQQLVRKAELYPKVLDKAIVSILAPSIGRADDQFLMSDAIIPLYGVGSTPAEAMEDYRSVVVEYYEGLEAEADELAPALRNQLDMLRQVFEPLENVECVAAIGRSNEMDRSVALSRWSYHDIQRSRIASNQTAD